MSNRILPVWWFALSLIVGCSHSASKPQAAARPADAAASAQKTAGKTAKAGSAAAAPDKLVKAVTTAVDEWAASWESRSAARYLAAYAPDFKPENGAGRASWEKQRRERLAKAAKIKVTVGDPQISSLGPDRAQASFEQFYESGSYSDRTDKVLEMHNVGGHWLIVREYSR